jgi:hypothetical protein
MTDTRLEYLKRVVDGLSVEDQLSLIEHVAKKLRQTQSTGSSSGQEEQRAPVDLYGIWRDHFPPDLDIDAALQEIRHEWEKEWPEVFKS